MNDSTNIPIPKLDTGYQLNRYTVLEDGYNASIQILPFSLIHFSWVVCCLKQPVFLDTEHGYGPLSIET